VNVESEKYWLFAIDGGPRKTLQPFLDFEQFLFCDSVKCEHFKNDWDNFFLDCKPHGVVVGTSRSKEGVYKEKMFRYFANKHQVRVVIVEDYPGNYQHHKGIYTDLLIVESEDYKEKVRSLYDCSQVGKVETGAVIRYSDINTKFTQNYGQYKNAIIQRKGKKVVLWIGQPEYENCLTTLNRIIGDLALLNVKLLFKSHPRDKGYKNGKYNQFMQECQVEVVDVSKHSLDECIRLYPDIVVTQFSSVAVEMGFYGIPSVHVLFSDVGGARLYDMYNYYRPEICSNKASVLIDSKEDQLSKLNEVINNLGFRNKLMENFSCYFRVNGTAAERVVQKILIQ